MSGLWDLKPMTRIVKARCYVLEYDLQGYQLSYGTINKVQNVVLKLTDIDGIEGWGEANPMQPFTKESVKDVVELLLKDLLPLVLTQERPDPEAVDRLLDQRHRSNLIAKGSISMALLDIQGKRNGMPVAELLGQVLHRSLPVLWPLSDQSPQQDLASIDEKLGEGFQTFMLKMGQRNLQGEPNIAKHAERITRLKTRYGNGIQLVADANTGWTVDESKRFLHAVRKLDLAFLEQPVCKDDIPGMANLVQATIIPISADESLTGAAQAQNLVDQNACTIFSIKSSKNGGPLRARALCNLADKYGIRLYMNSMLELGITQAASLQLAVTRSNLVDAGHAFMSTLRLDGDPTNFSTFIRDGRVYLPDAPGLGIEVDEAKVRSLVVDEFDVHDTGSY